MNSIFKKALHCVLLLNIMFISTAYAQEAAAAPAGAPGGLLGSLAPLVVIFFIFYFLLVRPQQKQQKLRQQMLGQLKRGDEVVTNGGVYGKITDLTDAIVMLQIASNVTIKVDRAQVNSVVAKES